MKQARFLLPVMIISLITMLNGCYPDKIDYVDEYDIAATKYDDAFDFASNATFTVVDTIMHLTEDGEDDPNFSRDNDAYILGLIRDNMSAKGYTEISNPDSLNIADLTLFVEVLSSDYYQYWGYYYDYWGYYGSWGWGGGYWGGYYPWYPSYPWYPGYVTSYSTGTLMIEMFDSHSYDPVEHTVDGVWMGVVDGLLTGNDSSTKQRLKKQIDQVFTQSDYLQK